MKAACTTFLVLVFLTSGLAQIKLDDAVSKEISWNVSTVKFPPMAATSLKSALAAIPRDASVSFALPRENAGFEPFFCALESKIRDKSGVLCKFRLGSVQYVDALEGKSYFHAVSNSQTTSKMLSVKKDR